jgi:hypothetical protein
MFSYGRLRALGGGTGGVMPSKQTLTETPTDPGFHRGAGQKWIQSRRYGGSISVVCCRSPKQIRTPLRTPWTVHARGPGWDLAGRAPRAGE